MRELEDQIAAILRKLPVLPQMDHYVAVAAQLIIENDYYALRPEDYRPSGDKKAVRELEKLAEHLSAAQHILDNMSDEAQSALFAEPPGIFNDRFYELVPERTLRGLESLALSAKKRLEAKPVREPGRRPPNTHAATVAAIAVGVYELLTGNTAGVSTDPYSNARGGPFLRFLRELFARLDIKASAESQAKSAVEKKNIRNIDMAIILDHMQGRKGHRKATP